MPNVNTGATPDEPLLIEDAAAWRAWLDANERESDGVWLLLAKKGTVMPTSLTYDQALRAALCSGWIDGQKRSHDAAMFMQRFTPRRPRSVWSQRNVGIVAELIEAGLMRPRGHAEIERAQEDGRWERAYAGSATAEIPDDLVAALEKSPHAQARFGALSAAERYSVLFPLMTATPQQRDLRIEKAVQKLEDEQRRLGGAE